MASTSETPHTSPSASLSGWNILLEHSMNYPLIYTRVTCAVEGEVRGRGGSRALNPLPPTSQLARSTEALAEREREARGMRSAAYGSSTRPGLGVHHSAAANHSSSSSSHNHSPWAATPVVAAHTAPGVASHAAASAYPPLGATPPCRGGECRGAWRRWQQRRRFQRRRSSLALASSQLAPAARAPCTPAAQQSRWQPRGALE